LVDTFESMMMQGLANPKYIRNNFKMWLRSNTCEQP